MLVAGGGYGGQAYFLLPSLPPFGRRGGIAPPSRPVQRPQRTPHPHSPTHDTRMRSPAPQSSPLRQSPKSADNAFAVKKGPTVSAPVLAAPAAPFAIPPPRIRVHPRNPRPVRLSRLAPQSAFLGFFLCALCHLWIMPFFDARSTPARPARSSHLFPHARPTPRFSLLPSPPRRPVSVARLALAVSLLPGLNLRQSAKSADNAFAVRTRSTVSAPVRAAPAASIAIRHSQFPNPPPLLAPLASLASFAALPLSVSWRSWRSWRLGGSLFGFRWSA